MNRCLLIIEDNEEVRRQLRWAFSGENCQVLLAGGAAEALDMQRKKKPGVVTLDLGLPPDAEGCSEGFRCLEALLDFDPRTRVIVITGHHDADNALRSIRGGACDFCRKPVNLEELKVIVRRAFFLRELAAEGNDREKDGTDHGIISECRAMRQVLETIAKVAASDAPVLITGESGTGKELAAKAIHSLSARAGGPMVAVNCGAIPENLLESEFFGHEKGSFTGAAQRVQGKVEYAEGGTLFLDEIGELPTPLQVKLLRFLQEMVIQRVGGRQDIPVNARVIAATNRDIEAAIKTGHFREDLFYRVGVVTVLLPPLREREDDVLLLARHFASLFDASGKIRGFSAAAEKAMKDYPWPGNVRELENKVRRAIIFAEGPLITPVELGFAGKEEEAEAAPGDKEDAPLRSLREVRNAAEKELLLAALERSSGNIMQAAQAMGISRPTLYDLLKKHKLEL